MNATKTAPTGSLLSKLSLDSQTSEPYYLQLKRQINALIASGELPAGTSLPSERLLAEALQMEDFLDRQTEGFSHGQRTKTAIARALVHDPRNVILDEPTN